MEEVLLRILPVHAFGGAFLHKISLLTIWCLATCINFRSVQGWLSLDTSEINLKKQIRSVQESYLQTLLKCIQVARHPVVEKPIL